MKKKLIVSFIFLNLCITSSITYGATDEQSLQQIKIKDEKQIIFKKGISESLLFQLGDDADIVANVIKEEKNISSEKLRNLVTGLIKAKTFKDVGIKREINNGKVITSKGEEIAVPKLQSQDSFSGRKTEPISSLSNTYLTGTGPHYVVSSNTGYAKATGYFTLPTTNTVGNTETAYVIGGIYTSNSGADLGLYSKDDLTWTPCINMGGTNWGGDGGWYESTVHISKASVPTLYLIWKTNDNEVELQTYDGYSFELLSAISYYAPNRGFNKAGSGVSIKREHALAYSSGEGDLTNGSYYLNSHWFNVYIYNNYITSQWSANYTSSRVKGDTADEQSTITLNSSMYDYDDSVSIIFNKP
ncbi:hypothetical protein [Paenibacillus oryzisoli]|uniref:Uncharacterized protein n=1 Tax=Paenibacillus oryzisoli TaxID=1850517 RepID=A0A198A4H1_9BACL|nr:hypothetical protein [Paenibacillus oryzisoli]OAS16032.1 hypothetical protein A8708_05490 [Paenibacillus oryzisoli]